MGVTVALGLGPSLGGLAIDIFDWRALFLVPIPACIAAVVLGVLFLPPEDEEVSPPATSTCLALS